MWDILYYLLTKRLGLSFRESYLYCKFRLCIPWTFICLYVIRNAIILAIGDVICMEHNFIIDPLFTITLIILVIFSIIKKKLYLQGLHLFGLSFIGLWGLQHNRAGKIVFSNALSRGHTPKNIQVNQV